MTYTALYREWRPHTFAEVVGQEHVVTTLVNALKLDKLAHAYLFSGPRGTGKTSLAKILAKAVNCENPQGVEPCNVCASCTGIAADRVVDVVEMDAASNRGIDEIRSLLEQVQYTPTEVKYKVYIIDEVHMLTSEAFNALLKTLEEPPNYCVFLLATTEIHKVPATVASRCQRFDFGRVPSEKIVDRLRQVAASLNVQVEEPAYWYVARAAEGGLRDALSLFDQALAFSDGLIGVQEVAEVSGGVQSEKIGYIFRCLILHEPEELLRGLSDLWQKGTDPLMLLLEMLAYGRDAILYKNQVVIKEIQDREKFDPTFRVILQDFHSNDLIRMVDHLVKWQTELRYQTQARLFIEVGLLALATDMDLVRDQPVALQAAVAAVEPASNKAPVIHPDAAAAIRALTERVSALEKQLLRGGNVPVGGAEKVSAAPVVTMPKKGVAGLSGFTGISESSEDQQWLAKILNAWQAVLEEVKKQSIQTRAWLYAGKPVAVRNHQLVAVFNSKIHAETVMRSPHIEIIQNALELLLQAPIRFRAVREEDWVELLALNQSQEKDSGLEPWVEKVVGWFGEERIEMLDETE